MAEPGIKVVLVGDFYVGKTALYNLFNDQQATDDESRKPDFVTKTWLVDGEHFTVSVFMCVCALLEITDLVACGVLA